MFKASRLGLSILAAGAALAAPLTMTAANATPPPPFQVFSDNFESPAVGSGFPSTTPLSGDAKWATPGSGYILNNFGNINAPNNQTQILGFGALGSGGDVFSIPIPQDPNYLTYNLSTNYATDGDDGFIGVRAYNSSDVQLGNDMWIMGGAGSPGYGQLLTLPNSTDWTTTYSEDFTVPDGTAYLIIMVEDFAGSPSSPSAFFDNIVLSRYGTSSTITNTSPSQGAYTNKGTTAVFHAVVTSADPSCIAGRSVTFTPNGGLSPQTVLTDAYGLASAKYAVTIPFTYTVVTTLAATDACGGGSDTDLIPFISKK